MSPTFASSASLLARWQDHAATGARWAGVALFFAFPLSLALGNVLMLVLLLLWLVAGRHRERLLPLARNPVVVLALALYALMLLGSLYTVAPASDVALHLKKYAKLLVLVALVGVLGDETVRRRCLGAFGAAMAFILVSTYLNIWFLLPWSESQHLGLGESHHVVGDYITQNVMMSFFVLMLLTAARFEPRRLWRAALLTVAALAAISITHLSSGRTGYVLLFAVLLTFLVLATPWRWRIPAIVVCSVVALVGVATSNMAQDRLGTAVKEFTERDLDPLSSIGHRLYNVETSLALMAERPLTGWGTGAYHTKICDVVDKPEWCPIFHWHPHNQFLFFGVEHGLAGVVLLVLWIASWVWVARKIPDPRGRILLAGLAVMLSVNSLFNSPLWSARESHFFILMIALLAAAMPLSGAPAPSPSRTGHTP